MKISMVVYGKRGWKVRDETGPREKKNSPKQRIVDFVCETEKAYNKPKVENNSI
jgi:hypothetical protein